MRVNEFWTPEELDEINGSFDEVRNNVKMDFPACRRNLSDLHKRFNQVGIPHFMLFGTLLGALREEDFIRGDHDTDLGILEKDGEALAGLVRFGMVKYDGWQPIRIWPTLVSLARDGEYVDIYIFCDSPDPDKWWSCETYYLEKKYLNPPGAITFWGETYQTVNNIGSYLTDRYGDFWRPTNQQATR